MPITNIFFRLRKLIPLRFKVWLAANIPAITSVDRQIIKLKLKIRESQHLSTLITKTQKTLEETQTSTNEIKINVISLIKSKKSDISTKKTQSKNKNITFWTINLNNSQPKAFEIIVSGIPENEYICLLEEKDSFLPNALNFIASKIKDQDHPDLVYWDHITTIESEKSERTIQHNFKPGWSPDYLLGFNYIDRSALLKKSAINKAFRDLAPHNISAAIFSVFANESIKKKPRSILHIDEPIQTLHKIEANKEHNIQYDLELNIVKNILNGSAHVTRREPETREILFVTNRKITSTIIIPTRDGYKILKKCIDSILKSDTTKDDNILIINNESTCRKTLKYLNYLKENNIANVLDYPHPFNYSAINNFAAEQCNSDVLVLLNNDIEVISDNWLQALKANAIRPSVGCVGAKLYYPDGTIQHGGIIIGLGGVADHAFKNEKGNNKGYQFRLVTNQNYSAVTAACLAVRKKTFLDAGGLNKENLSVAFNDVDLCLKVEKQGLTNLWLSNVELKHHESKTRGYDAHPEKAARFLQEAAYMKKIWKTDHRKDIYYNKNLSKRNHFFSINYD